MIFCQSTKKKNEGLVHIFDIDFSLDFSPRPLLLISSHEVSFLFNFEQLVQKQTVYMLQYYENHCSQITPSLNKISVHSYLYIVLYVIQQFQQSCDNGSQYIALGKLFPRRKGLLTKDSKTQEKIEFKPYTIKSLSNPLI